MKYPYPKDGSHLHVGDLTKSMQGIVPTRGPYVYLGIDETPRLSGAIKFPYVFWCSYREMLVPMLHTGWMRPVFRIPECSPGPSNSLAYGTTTEPSDASGGCRR